MAVRSSLAWMAGAQLGTVVFQFLSQVVLARCLSVHDNGIYAFALSIVLLLSLIQAAGLKTLIIREEVLNREVVATAFTMNAIVLGLMSLAIFAVAGLGGRFLGDPGVAYVLRAMAVTPLLTILAFVPASMLEREGRFREIAVIGVASSLGGAIATIAFALTGHSYMSVPYGQWVTNGITLLLTVVIGREHLFFAISFRSWRRIGHFGAQMLAVAGVNTASAKLAEVALARLLGLTAMGLFYRATSINQMLWSNVHMLIGRVMLIEFSSLNRQGAVFRERYMTALEMSTGLLWPMFGGVAVLSAPLLHIVFGEQWVPAATAMSLVLFASMIHVSMSMAWEVFAARDEMGTITRIEYIRAGITLVAFVAACFVSLEAAAAARVFDGVLALFLYRPHLLRLTGCSAGDLNRCYRRSGLLTLLACLPAAALVLTAERPSLLPVGLIVGAVLSGIALWAVGLVAIQHLLLDEISRFVPPVRRWRRS